MGVPAGLAIAVTLLASFGRVDGTSMNESVVADVVRLGLGPRTPSTLGVDGGEALTVLQRAAEREAGFDQLEALQASLVEHRRSLAAANAAARDAVSDADLSQAESAAAESQQLIGSTTTQIGTLKAALLQTLLAGIADAASAERVSQAGGIRALLPAEFRAVDLSDDEALTLLGAIGRERAAQRADVDPDAQTQAILSGYRARSDVSQAIAWQDSLTALVQGAFDSYGQSP